MLGRSRADAGEFKISTVVWAALFGAIIYFGVMYVPIYAEYYEVRSMLQVVANKHWRTSEYDHEKVKDEILREAKEIGETVEFQEGKPTKLAGLMLLADDVFVNRDDEWLVLQVKYTRYIKYPFINKNTHLSFTPMVRVSSKVVDWKH